jgi:predicted membrane channel-forming protein YqfA (hemolysin III family)
MIPSSISLGLNIGGLAGFVFFIANLYIILKEIHKHFFSNSEWAWLNSMKDKWHYVHYLGNITAIVLVVVHAIFLNPYASFVHWILVALLVLMGIMGILMRFTKIPAEMKLKIRKYHARVYMLVLVILLILLSHILSLSNFPYSLE